MYQAGWDYYLKLAAVTPPFLIMASSLAVMFTMVLVNVFPARRTKDILLLLSILVVIVLYLLFRFIRPERLVNPESFVSTVSYFASLRSPASSYLPSHWLAEVLWPSLKATPFSDWPVKAGLLFTTSGAMAVFASWVSAALYVRGFTRSQEGARRPAGAATAINGLIGLMGRPLAPESRVLIAKEVKTFFRDNTQWSQLLLLLALVVIYLYNFSVLDLKRFPLRAFYLQNIISFLNIGLAAFVTASLGVRFVFPAVSQEGFSYWIIRSSPLGLERFLWTKFYIYAPPLIVLGETLIIFSNYLLDVSLHMMVLSVATIFFLTLGIVALGIGLGAAYPRFESENIAAAATGFGGMIFMIISSIYVALVICIEAWPVSVLLRAHYRGIVIPSWKIGLMVLCLGVVLAINILAVRLPMKWGYRRLLARETE